MFQISKQQDEFNSEDDGDFDKLDSEQDNEDASYGDEDYKKKSKKRLKKTKQVKIGKKRKYDDARKFVELEAQSSDEEEEEFQKDKKDQYYKPGELAQRTKQLNL